MDANQKAVVAILRQAGFSVAITSMVGKGFVDLVAGRNGINYLIELKAEGAPKRKDQQKQKDFHASWRGSILVINSESEILKFIANV